MQAEPVITFFYVFCQALWLLADRRVSCHNPSCPSLTKRGNFGTRQHRPSMIIESL